MIKKEPIHEIYLVRALAIMGVIMVHATSSAIGQIPTDSTLYYVYSFFNRFFKFGTPTFIFLSSFVLFYNYYARPVDEKLIWKFARNRFLYILLPYLLFSIGYFLLKWYLNPGALPDGDMAKLKLFLNQLIWGKAYTHLYFVFISIQFYVLFPLFLYLFQKVRWIRQYAIIIGIILQGAFIVLNKEYFHIPNRGSIALLLTSTVTEVAFLDFFT